MLSVRCLSSRRDANRSPNSVFKRNIVVSAQLEALARAVETDAARPDLATNSRRAYASDWWDFTDFCGRHGLEPLPAAPQTLALYLKELQQRPAAHPRSARAAQANAHAAGLSVATLRRRLAAIALEHGRRQLESPTTHPLVRQVIRLYARRRGTAVRKKSALTIDLLATIVASLGEELDDARDRALLLLGYAGAFRRSELVGLDRTDLRFTRKGLYVTARGSKTDQEKKGRELFVPRLPTLCAVDALARWIERASIGEGDPLFRSFDLRGALTARRLGAGEVARIVQRRAHAAGLDGDFAGHSVRRGFITNAARRKVPVEQIMRVSGHRSRAIVLDYVEASEIDADPPLAEIVAGLVQMG